MSYSHFGALQNSFWHGLLLKPRYMKKYCQALCRVMGHKMQVQYPGVNGQTLTVKIDNVTIDRPKKMKVVFYNYLTEVEHKEPAGDLFGYITVRDILSKNKPIPQTYEEAQRDPMTILYEPAHTSCYRRLYDALREIVDMNRR